jgi:hypothetical protein
MNGKRYLFASIVVTIFIFIWEWLWNSIVLNGYYQATAALWRTHEQMASLCGWMIAAYIIFAFIFCFIYTRCHRDGGVKRGFSFGFWLSLLITVMILVWYVVLPVPGILVFWWIVGGIIEVTISGLLVGAIYKNNR